MTPCTTHDFVLSDIHGHHIVPDSLNIDTAIKRRYRVEALKVWACLRWKIHILVQDAPQSQIDIPAIYEESTRNINRRFSPRLVSSINVPITF